MEFSINHPILFVLVAIVIAVVVAQSVVFLIRALKRAKELNIDNTKIKKIIKSAAIFTIAPAVAIVISVIALSRDLGLPLPWLRLSVIGSMSYETIAAENAESAMGLTLGQVTSLTAQQYITIIWVMTICILVGIWLAPLLSKKILSGMAKIENKDKKWGDILQNALFIGMISAFLGYVFSDVLTLTQGSFAGLVPVCVFAVSAIVMALCGLALKKLGWKWLNDYALPLSLVLGMASAIPFSNWLA